MIRCSGEQKRGADNNLRISKQANEVIVAASVSMETTSLKFDSSCPIYGLSPFLALNCPLKLGQSDYSTKDKIVQFLFIYKTKGNKGE